MEETFLSTITTGIAYYLASITVEFLSEPEFQYFLADHPFIFVLKYGPTILFEGKCARPKSGDNRIAPTGEPVYDHLAHDIHIKLED
ncbi:hypothetical protein WA026_000780 [Henosepilachna vigintioctopunctata]|uniref:Cytochrome P450 n=1 Tax=Henosepilachna vigintioctopunctata TaxID=420089 RepID=A0AAW1V615_9CUCU